MPPDPAQQPARTLEIALLAPVPWTHLRSASQLKEATFGSDNWELFRKLNEVSSGQEVDVYIVATHLNEAIPDEERLWRALYIGSCEAGTEKFRQSEKHRPATTVTDTSFAVHWLIRDLRPAEWGLISEMIPFGKKESYGKPFRPQGPILIKHPLRDLS